MPATYYGPSLGALWRIIESYSKDPRPLFREVGIDPKVTTDPGSRVPYAKVLQVWNKAEELVGDPCFELKLADVWHPSHLGVLGYAWLASSSLRTALNRLARFARVVTEGSDLIVEEGNEGVSLVIQPKKVAPSLPVREDGGLALVLSMCRRNYGEQLNPISVAMKHSLPACTGRYYELFRCPVSFNAADSRITFRTEDVDRLLPGSNPELALLHDQIMVKYLARLKKEDISTRVRAVIVDQLPSGGISDETVAEALYMNSRTLQRRLCEAGTTFKSLLVEVRRELAEKYVLDQKLTITEISYLLGFSQTSAFSRAFKSWTGRAPSATRVHR